MRPQGSVLGISWFPFPLHPSSVPVGPFQTHTAPVFYQPNHNSSAVSLLLKDSALLSSCLLFHLFIYQARQLWMNHSQVLSSRLTNAGAGLKTWDITPVQLHKKLWKSSLVNTDRCALSPLSYTALVFHVSLCHVHYCQLSLSCSQWVVTKAVVVRINGSHFYRLKIKTREK